MLPSVCFLTWTKLAAPLHLPRSSSRPHVAYGAYPKVIKATFFSLDWTQARDTIKAGQVYREGILEIGTDTQ